MDKLSIKLKDLSPIIILLIEKIQQLDSSIVTKQQKLACTKEMLTVVNNLRAFFAGATASQNDENIKIFVEKIERALSQFEWDTNVAVPPFEFNKFSENGKELISSILKSLGLRRCGNLIIETYLKLCLKVTTDMTRKVENKNLSADKSDFKLLLDSFSSAANMLKKYWHTSFSPGQKSTIMLCLHQVCKVLPNLLKMIEYQNVDVRKYLLNLLTKCISKIQDEIHSDGNSRVCGQEFISMMDFCLYKLNEVSNCTTDFTSFIEKANKTVAVLKPSIDELLCIAMSIGQVTSFRDDYFAILAGSQKVLREFFELENEIKEKNGSAIKLNANSVGESLCYLEQKVNTAVLKLVLEVFSNVNSPLMNIISKCRMDITKNNKALEDLNILTSDFDSEMDKIMQIGFFAISCTTSLNRVLAIRSCLASLESLETELIPSVTAFYVDCSSKNRANCQYLFDFWLSEITELKVLIDSILDPAGFCGVVRNQVKCLNMAFKENISSSNLCLSKLKHNLKEGIRYSRKLIRTLKKSMEDDKETDKTTEDCFRKFQMAVQECEAVVDLMGQGEDSNKTINQAAKRFDLLMLALEKLSSQLFILVSKEEVETGDKESGTDQFDFPYLKIPQKNYYTLCEPVDVASTNNSIPEFLTPYVNKGILRSKKRNVLYTTPQQSTCEGESDRAVPQTKYWDKTPISSRRSRCCKPLTLNLELENTIDLEVTKILENISSLSNTFSRTLHGKSEGSKKDPRNSKDVACGGDRSSCDTEPTYKSSGCCAKLDSEDGLEAEYEAEDPGEKSFFDSKLQKSFRQALEDLSHSDSLLATYDSEVPTSVESLDRINDLKVVEEKIKFLKRQMPFNLP